MIREKKCALVTGATGFVGSRLVRRLVAENFDVYALTRRGSGRGQLEPVIAKIGIIEHDGSTEQLIGAIGRAAPNTVFHLASYFVGEHLPGQVTELIDSNVRFGAQLLEAMAVNGIRRLVNTGTSWQHFGNSPYRPASLYAATKQAFEAVLDFYIDAHDFHAITLKLFDTYGPGDPRPKLFSLLQQMAATGTVLDLTAGEQLIDLVYIDDVVEAFLSAGNRLLRGESHAREEYAVSSGCVVPLRQLVATYGRVLGADLTVRWGARAYRAREVMVPWSTGEPIPGWSPKVPLEEGIRRIGSYDPAGEVR